MLLKVALEVVIWLKGLVVARLRAADTRTAKTGAALLLWVVAAGSRSWCSRSSTSSSATP